MRRFTLATIQTLCLALVPAVLPAAQAGSGRPHQALLAKMIAAATAARPAPGRDAIKLQVREVEITSDGRSHKTTFTAWVNPASPVQRRLQLTPKVVIGFDGSTGWATIGGKEDQRRQTPLVARGTLNQKLFALLLPFSLEFPGVKITGVHKAAFEKKPALSLEVSFPRNFFYSPIMDTDWEVFVDPATYRVLGAQFLAPERYRKMAAEGMRYQVLTRKTVAGISLPTNVVVIGLGGDGVELGHTRTEKITLATVPYDPSLFLSPAKLAALDEG